MKKTVCWVLLVLLLTVGCAQNVPVPEEKTDAGDLPEATAEAIPETILEATPTEPPAAETGAQMPAIGGYEDFTAVVSAAILDGKSNKNLSPVSMYLALAMAAEGAGGDTLAELLALLGEENIEALRAVAAELMDSLDISTMTSELVMANSIWLGEQDETVRFHEAYLNVLADSYDAQAQAVRFGEAAAAQKIKAWILEKTRNKVKVSDDAMRFDADTLAVLINTIYLKDGWRTPFDEERTEEGVFFGLSGKEQKVKYMRQKDHDGTIARGDGFLRYSMPLVGVGTMSFILPDEGVSLQSLLDSAEGIDELLCGGEKSLAEVDVMMPKFSFQDRTDLEETLMSLGVRICFTGEANFSVMTDTPAYISRVLQESCIGVDEKGVEAAAYTMITMTKGASLPVEREKVDFHLTRPFLYAIESREGTVLFIGTVTAPDEA